MRFHIVTLFPEAILPYISSSILGRALEEKKIKVDFINPRDFVIPTKIQKNKSEPYLRIDDRPYGGGPGMVIQAEPIIKSIDKILSKIKRNKKSKPVIIFFTPGGKQFDNKLADNYLKKYTDIILISGRYEGIDARVQKIFKTDSISIGPYVLTGGEIPALVLIDTISRRIEGVLGNNISIEEERISSHEVYTRPEEIKYKNKKYKVPKILLSGNHKEIDNWRTKH